MRNFKQQTENLPKNIEAEQSLLCAVLLDNNTLNEIIGLVLSDDFYKKSHTFVFEAMLSMFQKSTVIDLVTLCNELRSQGKLEEAGGPSYFAELLDCAPRADNPVEYAKIIKEKSLLRKLMVASQEVFAKCLDETKSLPEILAASQNTFIEIANTRTKPALTFLNKIIPDVCSNIERACAEKKDITGVPSGFADLDSMTSGFHPGDFIILAARPAMGKTALAINMARNCCADTQKTVVVFSLEMSKEQLVQRMLAAEAEIDSSAMRKGFLGEKDLAKMNTSGSILFDLPMCIDDTPAITVLEIISQLRQLVNQGHEIGLVVIDYLQLMRGHTKTDRRDLEVSDISAGLKAAAKEFKAPILALSQLNRKVEERSIKVPMASDLRECVTGDTKVVLTDGSRVEIRSLVDSTPEVLSVDGNKKISSAVADKVWEVGVKDVFEIHLTSGRKVKATKKHRLLGFNKWMCVGDLKPGDMIAVARTIPEPKTFIRWPEERIILLGHLIGDGSYLSGSPIRYTTSCEECSKLVRECAERQFGSLVRRYDYKKTWHQLVFSGNGNRWHPAGLNKWLREIGIFNQRSFQKRIPVDVFRFNNQDVAFFLKHLWATDGSVTLKKCKKGMTYNIFYSTSSVELAHDVAFLLLRLGIIARIRCIPQGDYKPVYSVFIYGVENVKNFFNTVGVFGPRKKNEQAILNTLKDLKSNTNVDVIPRDVFTRVRALMREKKISYREMQRMRGCACGGSSNFDFDPSRGLLLEYANLLESTKLKQIATNDIFWDRIADIKYIGREKVYDLTVPCNSNWLADGIISHNSGALEQTADLVLMIYRDEVYNKESIDNKNLADLIIAKHRSGATGTIHLYFDKQYTKFKPLNKKYE